MKECEEFLSTVREEYQQLEEKFNKMKSEEVDVKNDLEKCNTQVKENEAKIKYWRKEVGHIYHCLLVSSISFNTFQNIPIMLRL